MRVLLRLTRYSWRYKWGLIGAYVSAAGATLSIVFIPRVIGTAVDTALASGLRSQLLLLAGVIFLLGLTRAAFTYGASRLAESVSQQAAFDLRNDYFRKLQSLSFGFHDKEQTGNLMSRGTYDVESVRRFMSYQLISGLSLVLTLGAAATLMLTMNWRLGIVSLVPVPFVMWVVVAMVRRRNHHWYQAMTETGHMTTVLQESLTNMRVVKAFGAQEHEQGRFHQRSNAIFGHMDSINVSSPCPGASANALQLPGPSCSILRF